MLTAAFLLIYGVFIIIALIMSIKAMGISIILLVLIKHFLGDRIIIFFNNNYFNYYLFLSLVFFFFFTVFLGFFMETNNKITVTDKMNLFLVVLGWGLVLYGRTEYNIIISFLGTNLLNFSSIKLYFGDKVQKGHFVYFLFSFYSVFCGWLFGLIFIYDYYRYFNIIWWGLIVITFVYYYFSYWKYGLKAFFR